MNTVSVIWAKLSSYLAPPSMKQRDKGAGFIEYAAIIILVATLAGLVYGLGILSDISGAIDENVSDILDTTPE